MSAKAEIGEVVTLKRMMIALMRRGYTYQQLNALIEEALMLALTEFAKEKEKAKGKRS